jgi:small subunit ribosomal protein S16
VAVKLRLTRMGKTKAPTYRIIVADARNQRDGRFIEILGTYEPLHDPSKVNLNNERAVHWLQQGAQPTDTVQKLLQESGAWATAGKQPVVPTKKTGRTKAAK